MTNWEVDGAVYKVLDQTLGASVALPRAVSGALFRDFHVTVNGTMGWDVNRAMYAAQIEDPSHPGLEFYLAAVP